MPYIEDIITFATDGTKVKEYCGVIDLSEDNIMKLWLEAATSACDTYINTEEDTYTVTTLPAPIRLGVYEYVRIQRDSHSRTPGLSSKTVGPFSESYNEDPTMSLSSVYEYWDPYVIQNSTYGFIRSYRA